MNTFNSYRFTLSILGIEHECFLDQEGMARGKSLKFKTEKESGQIFYRTKLADSVKFSAEDYKLLLSLEQSTDRHQPVGFLVERNIQGQYKPYWRGKFSVSEVKWNLSKSVAEVSISPVDAYTTILEEYEKQYNVLEIEQVHTVKTLFDFSLTFEFAGDNYAKNPGPAPESYGLFLTHFWKEPNIVGINRLFQRKVYFREVQTLPKENQEGPAGSGWDVVEEFDTTTKWARPPQIEGFVPYEIKGLIQFHLVRWPELAFIGCDSPTPDGWIDTRGCTEWLGLGNAKLVWEFGAFYYKYNRKLLDVLYFLVDRCNAQLLPSDKTDLSTFLTDAINPVTGEANEWLNAMLSQKSDVKNPNLTEPASKGMLSLKAILEDLKCINLYWFINPDGKLQIEHLSYFAPNFIVDTRPYPQNQFKKAYEYLKSKMPRYEKLRFSEEASDEFTESTIEYSGEGVNRKEGENTVTYSINSFLTDIETLTLSPDSYSNTGFVLFSVVPTTDPLMYNLAEEYVPSRDKLVKNYHFSAHRLAELYLRHGRVLRSGTINGEPTEFASVIKTKKQVQLSIAGCDYLPLSTALEGAEYSSDYSADFTSEGGESTGFHPLARFITELSAYGELQSAEHSLRDDYIRLDILHEAIEETTPFVKTGEYGKDYSIDYKA